MMARVAMVQLELVQSRGLDNSTRSGTLGVLSIQGTNTHPMASLCTLETYFVKA